jgi:SAM-dependent methyltransferase
MKIPVIKFCGRRYYPWHITALLKDFRKDMSRYLFCADGVQIKLKHEYATLLNEEWTLWQEAYLPPSGLEGKTVLDVGAGCGETALLFFLNGAKNVICVEPNKDAATLLSSNGKENGWQIEIFNEAFRLNHIRYAVEKGASLMKIDCEGGEEALLRMEKLPQLLSVIEVHTPRLKELFLRKFDNLRCYHTYQGKQEISILRNW